MPFHSGYGYYGTGDWLWSIFSTVLFIVLVTMAIMLLVRLFSGSRQQGAGPASRPVGGPWFGPGSGGPGAARSRWAQPRAQEPRQGSAAEPSVASAAWQQSAEPAVVTSAAQEQRTEEVR